MANTRKINIVDRAFISSGPGLYAYRCPACTGWIGIGERPYCKDGFRILGCGTILEMQVCLNRMGVGSDRIGDYYCPWEGFVRLTDPEEAEP